jgi:hypothetical protein
MDITTTHQAPQHKGDLAGIRYSAEIDGVLTLWEVLTPVQW